MPQTTVIPHLPPTHISPPVRSEVGYEGVVRQDAEGRNTLSLLIGGVHCAVCIQKIESAIQSFETVHSVRLNFSTGRLNIVWSGAAELANDFIATIKSLGYTVNPYNPDVDKSTVESENRFLLTCLGVAGFAMMNIMLLSVGLWTTTTQTMGFATRELLHGISGAIAIPAVIFSGRPFFRSALSVLKRGQTNMDVPISLGLILATGMSVFEVLRGAEHAYFDSAVMLMFFLLVGRYLDFQARRSAKRAASDLIQTLSGFATVVGDADEDAGTRPKRVLIRDLREGMRVLVAAGENIPVDSIVERGESMMDTSLITGETLPRHVGPHDRVFAGTVNQSAPLTLRVVKAAEDSVLADVVRLMEKAEQGQAKYVRLADRVARMYTPVVHSFAAAAFILWWGFIGVPWQDALMVAVTVLIVTCPCALGLAVPVVQVMASGLLMKRGVLVKAGDALERMAAIDTVVLDKTGTLTIGRPSLIGDYDPEDLKIAASLALQSRHPLSKALASAYHGDVYAVEEMTEHAGQGLQARVQARHVRLGSRAWCGDIQAPHHKNLGCLEDLEIWLAVEGRAPVGFRFQDRLRDDAVATLAELQQKGLTRVLLSGDRASVVALVAAKVGITEYLAEQTPIDKYNYIEGLKAKGHKVLMVGDGLNDAPVLVSADVSMAPGTAIDMAQNAADIVFMGDHLAPVAYTHSIARMTQALVKQNFMLSIVYNFIAIPLAFMGWITPMIAALAMSGSSLIVIANSFRLKRYR